MKYEEESFVFKTIITFFACYVLIDGLSGIYHGLVVKPINNGFWFHTMNHSYQIRTGILNIIALFFIPMLIWIKDSMIATKSVLFLLCSSTILNCLWGLPFLVGYDMLTHHDYRFKPVPIDFMWMVCKILIGLIIYVYMENLTKSNPLADYFYWIAAYFIFWIYIGHEPFNIVYVLLKS